MIDTWNGWLYTDRGFFEVMEDPIDHNPHAMGSPMAMGYSNPYRSAFLDVMIH